MKAEFYEQGNWILPKEGTLGNKAKNLLDNQEVIDRLGFKTPKSLVIPYEYYKGEEGPLYHVLDMINDHFPDNEVVMVRSNSPDEDKDGRTPGFYHSAEINHKNRGSKGRQMYDDLDAVLYSYHSDAAEARREKLGLEEKGMSLLVQEKIDVLNSGSFGDIGDLALLTFTNPDYGIESMMKPSKAKYWVDENGKIKGQRNTPNEYFGGRLNTLVKNLPEIKEKGWEIEFGATDPKDIYLFQTTPVVKKEKFQVKETEANIFDYRDVLGTGEFHTDGIAYCGMQRNLHNLIEFDKEHKNYTLVINHSLITMTQYESNKSRNVLNKLNNVSAILCIPRLSYDSRTFSAHISQFMRENRAALSGKFNNEWSKFLIPDLEVPRDELSLRFIYSPTKLSIQADEVEQKANVEIEGEKKDFKKWGKSGLDLFLEEGK